MLGQDDSEQSNDFFGEEMNIGRKENVCEEANANQMIACE